MRLKAASFLLVLFLAGVCVAQAPPKTTLGLMDLSCSGFSRNEGRLLNDRLLLEVANTDKFEVIERSKRDELLKEHGFAQTGFCDQTTCLIEAGKYLAVQKMVGGSVGKFGTTWTVNIRVVDVNTGKVEKTSIRDFKGEMDGLLAMMKEVAHEITQIPVLTPDQETLRQKHMADSLAALSEANRRAEIERQRQEEERKLAVQKERENIPTKQSASKVVSKPLPFSLSLCLGRWSNIGSSDNPGLITGANAGFTPLSFLEIDIGGGYGSAKASHINNVVFFKGTFYVKLAPPNGMFIPYIGAGPAYYKQSIMHSFGIDGLGGADFKITKNLYFGSQVKYGYNTSDPQYESLLLFLGLVKFRF